MSERGEANFEGVTGAQESSTGLKTSDSFVTNAPGGLTPRRVLHQQSANPDDPPVHRPPQGPHGPLPGPIFTGSPGRVAIVQGQIFIVAIIVIAQLWLITDALYEWLSGRPQYLGWLVLVSGVGFVVALIVWRWPERRISGK